MKPISVFPRIHDNSKFVVSEHPVYHPDTIQYTEYWENQEKKCVEGTWEQDCDGDLGGYRYCPGNIYFYSNFYTIEDQDDKGNSVGWITPLLRDVEWLMGYGWFVCRGFSGFEEDKWHTSYDLVKKIEDFGRDSLGPKDEYLFKKVEDVLRNPEGKLKKYIEPREYLYKTHEQFYGKALFLNQAKNFFCLGPRGYGKSYFLSGAIIGHEYNFDGNKYFDETYLINPAPVQIFVGAALSSKSSDLLRKFSSAQEWLKKKYGAWGSGNDFIPGYFYKNSIGSLASGNSKSPYRHEYKVKEGGTWVTKGSGTAILHETYTVENPQAAVGTRPTVMGIDEVGLMSNVLAVHASNETAMIRRTKFGSSFYSGTGGNMEKITESKIIFEDPVSYNFLPYKDLYEGRVKPIGFFLPAYYVDNTFKDGNGNTDIEASFKHEMQERKLREKATTSAALDGYMMARPIVPSEMFLSPTANIFPSARLREREAYILSNQVHEINSSIGMLHWDDDKKSVHWIEDVSRKMKPIMELNTDRLKGNLSGAIIIHEHPTEGIPNPSYKKSLYKTTYDPVKDDHGGTSFASILVHKAYAEKMWNAGLQNTIVAELKCRYDMVHDMHDMAIKMATYYNSKILVENNLPDFIRYCKMNNKYQLLQPCPYEAISKVLINPGRKYEVGVTMTKGLSLHCEQLIRQYLMEKFALTKDGKQLINVDNQYSLMLLRELIAYDRDKNLDHVSAFKLLVLWLSQEKEVVIQEHQEKTTPKDLDKFLRGSIRNFNYAKRPFHAY